MSSVDLSEPINASVTKSILGIRVDPMSRIAAVTKLISFARHGTKGYVCFAEAHMIMEAKSDPIFRRVVNGSILTTTDGTPVRWMATLLGSKDAETVDGPGLTPMLLQACESENIRVGFYGGSQTTLDSMLSSIRARYGKLMITYIYSPPFRMLTPSENAEIIRAIQSSGTQMLFVGLGCPKQERWMAAHTDDLSCVLLGVGAVFEFLAGTRKMPPPLVQQAGLTWLYRTLQEPRRLARRTLYDLPRFFVLATRQLLAYKLSSALPKRRLRLMSGR